MTVSRFRTILYIIVAIVAVVGLADATYLSVQALTGETLSCGGSPDCFRVLGSSYGKLGGIPVAMLGALAYFTVFLPLGLRTIASVVLQVDPSLEECARVCGAPWLYQMRTVTLPLLRPGMVAAWLLIFIASVRELGVSIFLMGPNSKVIAPAIVNSWLTSSSSPAARHLRRADR